MLARGRAAPLRFLIGAVTLWVTLRGAMVVDWRPRTLPRLGPMPGTLLERWPTADVAVPQAIASLATVSRARAIADRRQPGGPPRVGEAMAAQTMQLVAPGASVSVATDDDARPTGQSNAATILAGAPAAAASPLRWSGSAWMLLRGGGGGVTPLAPVGRIGGGQAGARILYRLDDAGRFAAAARISRAIGGPRQTEAALGLDWSPVRAVHLIAERRIAIDRGGRDAWSLGVAGGVYALPVAPGWRLDGYGEAGVVGARRRDLYADGAVRVGREIALPGTASLTLGGGLWGAAQPAAARLDAGPSAVLRLPVEGRTVAFALDWRERLTGEARPHSGVAFTVGVDF